MKTRHTMPPDDDTATYTISADGTRNYLPMKFVLDESGNPRVSWFGKVTIIQKQVEYTSKDRIHSPIIVAKVQTHMEATGLMKSQHSVMVFRLPLNDKGYDAIGLDDRDVQTLWTPDPRAKPPSQLCGGCGRKFLMGDPMFANAGGDAPLCQRCDSFMNPPITGSMVNI
jgi:hypothetical protein